MNLPFYIAWRYFYSKKSQHAINWISRISQAGITIGTMALIVVLSVFNGFEGVILSLYNSFDPDIKVLPNSGKYFTIDSTYLNQLHKLKGIEAMSAVIEENALVKNDEMQTIATIKGMTQHYFFATGIDEKIVAGEAVLSNNISHYALIGSGVAGKLGMNMFSSMSSLQLYFPNRKNPSTFSMTPTQLFQTYHIPTGGVFQIQQDFDDKYILVSLDFSRKLVKKPVQYTALEIVIQETTDKKQLERQIREILGENYLVQNRYEQHKWLYSIMQSEKFIVYLILSFILIVAGFNLIGSLLMLSIEKKKDMMILTSMGAENNLIRKVFFYEGLMLSLISAFAGLFLGVVFCLLQMHFSIIKLPESATFIINAYPVAFKAIDFVWVFITVVFLGLISSFFPARAAYKNLKMSEIGK